MFQLRFGYKYEMLRTTCQDRNPDDAMPWDLFRKLLLPSVYLMLFLVPTTHCSELTDRIPFTGPCKSRNPNYCPEHVANSVCNTQRDECFCRSGYVAIREADEIVCRTYLSCRIDADCTHVDGSICHPGAGKCVCPGGTVFVAHLHACRKRIFTGQSDICEMCIALGGVCFAFQETEIQNNTPSSGIGCECSSISTNEVRVHGLMNDAYQRVCPFNLVPIIRQPLSPIVSPYENAPKGRQQCSKCQVAGGQCYDQDLDDVADGCHCSTDRSKPNHGVLTICQKQPGQYLLRLSFGYAKGGKILFCMTG
ncbi:unnamed protein product [Echinostoma caproni]|uniref:EGF-like domain-containing protein n=1 Tax=Echinostoma caproni TaxID=27848 RepID=A0A183AN09_9TREM|nr:unnamed protein product [Echinostoma caproni]